MRWIDQIFWINSHVECNLVKRSHHVNSEVPKVSLHTLDTRLPDQMQFSLLVTGFPDDHMLDTMKWTDHRFPWSKAISQRQTPTSWQRLLINIIVPPHFGKFSASFYFLYIFVNLYDHNKKLNHVSYHIFTSVKIL